MDKMFRVLGFWTGVFTIMFIVGGMYNNAMLFFLQTVLFIGMSYMKLEEKIYIYFFMAYLSIFFIGFTYYTTF